VVRIINLKYKNDDYSGIVVTRIISIDFSGRIKIFVRSSNTFNNGSTKNTRKSSKTLYEDLHTTGDPFNARH
jgi:hypothetical protein